MGYKKTDSLEGIRSWAQDVQNRLRPNDRRGLLRKKEKGKKDKKSKPDVRNN